MEVAPEATYEAVIDTGETGLTGTIGTRVNDNTGTTTTAFSAADITEIATGIYAATGRVAPDTRGQYSIIWTRGLSGEVLGLEDLIVTASAPIGPGSGDTYATADELARILKIRTPTADQTAAMERVLTVAAGEINAEIDLDEDSALAGWQVALATEVNLERAVEHWQQMEAPFGIVDLGVAGSSFTARDSWERHAHKLAPLKGQWGLA